MMSRDRRIVSDVNRACTLVQAKLTKSLSYIIHLPYISRIDKLNPAPLSLENCQLHPLSSPNSAFVILAPLLTAIISHVTSVLEPGLKGPTVR